MGYELESRGVRVPGKGKIFLFTASTWALKPTQSPSERVPMAPSLGVKRPGPEVNHSPLTSAEFKNVGAIPSLTHTSSCRGD
jgi:hypothetical protein